MQLDFRSGLPVYRQIFRQVQRQASSGALRPGDQLPTVRELAVLLGVNFNTVARAYRLLDRARLVSAQPGRGTFVAQRLAGSRAPHAVLKALAADFIAQAQHQGFTRAEIAAMVSSGLKTDSRREPRGGQ